MNEEQDLDKIKKEARRNKILGNIFVLGGVAFFMAGLFLFLNNAYTKILDSAIIFVGLVSLFIGILFQASKAVQDQIQKKNKENGSYDENRLERSVRVSGIIAFSLGFFMVLIFVFGYFVLHRNIAVLPVFLILGIFYIGFSWNLIRRPLNSKKSFYILTLVTVAIGLYSTIIVKGVGLIWLALLANLITVMVRLKKAKVY